MPKILKHVRDATLNDSNKIILTVPANKAYEIIYGYVTLVSTATAGNRQILIEVHDDTATIVFESHAGTAQAANLTYHYVLNQGTFRETSVVDGAIHTPIPMGLVLLPGWTLTVRDATAVDAAADDMTINIVYRDLNDVDVGSLS